MSHARCFVHGTMFPASLLHVHHEAPRHTGGSDDASNLVRLCPTCHDSSHRLAQMVHNGKRGEANDAAMSLFPNPVQRKRLIQTVREIVAAEVLAKDMGIQTEDAEIRLSLPRQTLEKLKVLAHERKHNGKRVGVGRYIEALINKHLRDKGLL